MPPQAASAPASAQDSEKMVPAEMPCAIAVSWSAAVARIANPYRERASHSASAPMMTTAATTLKMST